MNPEMKTDTEHFQKPIFVQYTFPYNKILLHFRIDSITVSKGLKAQGDESECFFFALRTAVTKPVDYTPPFPKFSAGRPARINSTAIRTYPQ